MNDTPDVELMALAAKGETSAFATLVERYQNVLLNFFLRRGVSYDDGQDLAQQTFLRLWNYRKKYTPQAKFTTFLFLLAGQVSVDFFRAEGRRRGLEEGLMREAEVAAVELGVFQDLPYAEVGEILGIPTGTVKSRMFNALRKLKELLA